MRKTLFRVVQIGLQQRCRVAEERLLELLPLRESLLVADVRTVWNCRVVLLTAVSRRFTALPEKRVFSRQLFERRK